MANTPLMDLQVIQIGQGGDSEITIWNKVISNFSRLDSHTHTPGDGGYITSAALQIDGSISFNNNQATQLNAVIFESQTVDVADKQGLYVKNGELVYRDQADNIVPITSAGGLAGTPGTIAGLVSPASASYDSLFGAFKFFADSNEYARLYSSDLVLSEFGVAGGFTTTLRVVGNTQNYSLTLPTTAPAANTSLLFNASGVATFTPAFKRGTTATNQVALVSSTDNTQLNGLTLANNQILLGTAGTPVSGQLTNAYVSASAAIAGTKISPAFGAQQITGSSGMNISAGAVSFGGNLAVTGTTALSNNLTTTGNVTLSGSGKTFTVNTTASFASTLSVSGTTTVGTLNGSFLTAGSVSVSGLLTTNQLTTTGTTIIGDAAADSFVVNATPIFNQDATFTKNVIMQGDVSLGNALTDIINVEGSINTNLIPLASNTRDLGSLSRTWRSGYFAGQINSTTFYSTSYGQFDGGVQTGAGNGFVKFKVFTGTTTKDGGIIDLILPSTPLGATGFYVNASTFSLGANGVFSNDPSTSIYFDFTSTPSNYVRLRKQTGSGSIAYRVIVFYT